MKKNVGLVLFTILSLITYSQNNLKVIVRSEETQEPLPGASIIIISLNKGTVSDSAGIAMFRGLPNGIFEMQVSYVGYSTLTKKINLPFAKTEIEIELDQTESEDNAEVIVTSTRTDRSVRNTPTRVEVIAAGEISENISMKPGEIRMLLNETAGLMAQQTSAVSSTASIRIQELDGRYTQVLRDGFPLYSGLSEGLSLVQIAPLDLKQVEIIKGSSSTLYGGGAIAGLINLVSKTPTDKIDLDFLVNGTSAKGLDLSGFYGERYGKTGMTLFASRNSGTPYDPSNVGLTAIPKFLRYTVTPRFFYNDKKININAGVSYITEDRLGGNINYVQHGVPGYFEENNSDRFTTQVGISTNLNEKISINFKNSYNHFNRRIIIPTYEFEGLQQSSFSEISLNAGTKKNQWITGVNLYTDDFKEMMHFTTPLRNYHNNTLGLFVQNTWSPNDLLSIESGLRGDHTSPYGLILLPRLSALFHFSENFSSRIGGGLGYKIPTIFNEQGEELHYQNILPIDDQTTNYERSIGGNIDFTYKTSIDELKLFVNPLFFYTRVNDPLILQAASGMEQQFVNAPGYTDSKGLDLSIKIAIDRFNVFTGYSYTIAKNHFDNTTTIYPLAPRHKIHFDLVYEIEDKLRVALESYYTGEQQLSDGKTGKQYWLLGALIERSWKKFSVFVNGEDLNDARQTKWDTIYTGTLDNPTFRDIYAPLDGIMINAGVKIKL
jgi:iron complex outermembrane receptor protein